MLASSSKATTILSSVRTVKIAATRTSTAKNTKAIVVLPPSTLGDGDISSSVVLEACLTAALPHHLGPTVLLPRDPMALLHTTTDTVLIMSTMVRKTVRGATMTTTTTMARVRPAQALTVREAVDMDAMVAAAATVAVTASEDEEGVALTADQAVTALMDTMVHLTMDLVAVLAALTTAHLHLHLLGVLAVVPTAVPTAIAAHTTMAVPVDEELGAVAVLLEVPSADQTSSAPSTMTLPLSSRRCGRLSLPSTPPTRATTPLRRTAKISLPKPISLTHPLPTSFTFLCPAQRRKTLV